VVQPAVDQQLLSRIGFNEALHSAGIAPEYATALYRTVLARRPTTVLEVGLAQGAATIAILSALAELGGDRRLISIDPYQSTQWKNVGLNNVKANGFASFHRLVEEPDYLALPSLLRQKTALELGYIDGWHTFDYVLLDFFYIDKMLCVGGAVGFNDCGYRAVHRAIRFMQTHRPYTEIDVGLPRNYQGRNIAASIGRRVLDRPNNDRWFEKASGPEPDWNFYASF
jgi:hypothetical protein